MCGVIMVYDMMFHYNIAEYNIPFHAQDTNDLG